MHTLGLFLYLVTLEFDIVYMYDMYICVYIYVFFIHAEGGVADPT